MNLKFTGTFESLKGKLSSLGGEWHEDQPSKKVLRLNGGLLNWFSSTGMNRPGFRRGSVV